MSIPMTHRIQATPCRVEATEIFGMMRNKQRCRTAVIVLHFLIKIFIDSALHSTFFAYFCRINMVSDHGKENI